MCQCRPANPMDPGDAADLSIMGYLLAPWHVPRTGAISSRHLRKSF
jgi:hypothetical protein